MAASGSPLDVPCIAQLEFLADPNGVIHLDDFLLLLDGEDVGYQTAVEQRVDVLEKGVVLQLRV